MSTIDVLWLAILNRNADDAGSDSTINLTVNIDGDDVHDHNYHNGAGDGEASLDGGGVDAPFDTTALNDSSIRIGVRDDDAWAPSDVLVFGQSHGDFNAGVAIPLAMESDITEWLSTDVSEGPLTVPLRRVIPGDSTTVIQRVLLLTHTQWSAWTVFSPFSSAETGTDSAIQLEVFAGGNLVLREEVHDTPQSDLERGAGNWYMMDALVPFTRGEVQAGGKVVLSILGSDAWKPQSLFVFGLDTASGRPNRVVSLVSKSVWGERWMSTDSGEGDASVELAITAG